ncbi:hypothetical protein HMPREF9453_00562 [Dialister succinatiphilus YIT 11850]|uniref:Uncharacterized protein n=2 Tax=Dialister succinatiphilus TaxID=487173 RepID=H1CYX4_9FIRM|nr:hypothetical protein HMPREF9453_00562 [Dialister succinatiphilus YIT 11850]
MIEPVAYGELKLTPSTLGELTMKEFNALVNGYVRRRDSFENLLILRCALPVYSSMLGEKAPTFDDLTAYRKLRDKRPEKHDSRYESDVKYWSKKLDELERKDKCLKAKKSKQK